MMPHHATTSPTPFIGRTRELNKLGVLLKRPDTKLISIIGPGGIGKTRLAQTLEEQYQADFGGQVYFVPLLNLTEVRQIPSAIANSIGFSYFDDSNSVESLFNYLKDKKLLLVLDNFEHLLDGADLVNALATLCPQIKLVITSREKLNLRSEISFLMEGLRFEDAQTLESALMAEAIQLFLVTAQRTNPDFQLTTENLVDVVRLCRLVDGMPLGIELAAAWVDVLVPADIAGEIERSVQFLDVNLRDMPVRHRNMLAVFESSWKLLTLEQREYLENMAVFRGGFTRLAVQAVTGADVPLLQILMNKSFLKRMDNGRYELHGLLRQYAEEQLVNAGRIATLRQKHADYFLSWLHQIESNLKGDDQLKTLREISADFENIREAWAFALGNGDHVSIANAVESVFLYCLMHSRYMDAEQFFQNAERVLTNPLAIRINLRRRWLRRWREGGFGSQENVLVYLESSLNLLEEHTLPQDAAICRLMLGDALRDDNTDFALSERYLHEALVYFQAQDDDFYAAWALHFLARLAGQTGGITRAIDLQRQSLELRQQRGDRTGIIYSQYNLSIDLLLMGEFEQSVQIARAMVENSQMMGERSGQLMANTTLCLNLLFQGDLGGAWRMSEENLKAASEINHLFGRTFVLITQGICAGLEGDILDAQSKLHLADELASQDVARFFINWGMALTLLQSDNETLFSQYLHSALRYARGIRATGASVWSLLLGGLWLSLHHQLPQAVELLKLVEYPVVGSWHENWKLFQTIAERAEKHLFSADAVTAERVLSQAYLDSLADDLVRHLWGDNPAGNFPQEVLTANQVLTDPLSLRELEVLALIALGLSNQEIADRLFVGVSTVKKHITHIYEKLNVNTRPQVILRAQKLGLS